MSGRSKEGPSRTSKNHRSLYGKKEIPIWGNLVGVKSSRLDKKKGKKLKNPRGKGGFAENNGPQLKANTYKNRL